MKHWIRILTLLLCLALAVGAMSACDKEVEKSGGKIAFQTLTVEGTTVKGTVPNEQESFSFLEEIKLEGDVSYTVALDLAGLNVSATKTVILAEGDNVFYVTVKAGETETLYTVTIHRELPLPDAEETGPFTYTETDGKKVLTKYRDYSTPACEIPDGVDAIGESALAFNSFVERVVIPASVTEIDPSAFKGCSGLTEIAVDEANPIYASTGNCLIEKATKTLIAGCKGSVIPDDGSVTAIGAGAFYANDGVTALTVPASVKSIGDDAFWSCESLAEITLSEGLLTIGETAFLRCEALQSLAIPASVTEITEGAFAHCGSLDAITVAEGNVRYHSAGNCLIETATKRLIVGANTSVIPDDGSVETVAYAAFEGRDALSEIKLPASVSRVETVAFSECASLASITVDSANEVYHSAGNCLIKTETGELILGCKSSVIPADGSVREIGFSAFRGAVELTSMVIPEGVTVIGGSAFEDCTALASISIPASATSIEFCAFLHCEALVDVTFGDATGWSCKKSWEEEITPLAPEMLGDDATAAGYLSEEYAFHDWMKEEN